MADEDLDPDEAEQVAPIDKVLYGTFLMDEPDLQ